MSLQAQLNKAVQKEKQYLQSMVSKETYEELARKSAACQDDLTQALEKVGQGCLGAKKCPSSMRGIGINFLHCWPSPRPCANPCMSCDVCPEKACFLLGFGEEGGQDGGQV